jgi:hypothetical protein
VDRRGVKLLLEPRNLGWVLLTPLAPGLVRELVLYPLSNVRLPLLVGRLPVSATRATVLEIDVLVAEEQAASIPAVWLLIAADIGQPTVDPGVSFRVVANSRDAVSDVPVPRVVIANGPAHIISSLG